MSELELPSAEAVPQWSIARATGYSLLIAGAWFTLQFALVVAMFAVRFAADPDLKVDEVAEGLESDGGFIALSAITLCLLVPFVKFLVGRREADPWAFLGLRSIDARSILMWSLALIAFVVASDSLTIAIGRSVVPEFMIEVYSSANPVLLFVAVTFAAPLYEEIFFRGFVLGALRSSGVSAVLTAVVSSLAWSALHLQYDLYGIATIFAIGLLLAAAREKTGSLVPCLVMHGLGNLIAFTETVFAAKSAGV